MKIFKSPLFVYVLLAITALWFWSKLSYPQFSFLRLQVGRDAAVAAARDFLKERGADPSTYKVAAVFRKSDWTILFLQRTIGVSKIPSYAAENNLEIFYWNVRFFKPKQKEEYRVSVDSADGNIMAFVHTLETGAERPFVDKNVAKDIATSFLKNNYGFLEEGYVLKEDATQKFDRRTDYVFTWEKKNSRIPWGATSGKESAKILTWVTVSGQEISGFDKGYLYIPDEFPRQFETIKNTGRNITAFLSPLKLALMIVAMFFLIVHWSRVVIQTIRKFYFGIVGVFIILSIINFFNFFQSTLHSYPTTYDWFSFFWQDTIAQAQSIFFLAIMICVPALAGETLHYETSKSRPEGSFLTYLRTTFMSQQMAVGIGMGYLCGAILLGIQSVLFTVGEKYFNVWTEFQFLTQWTSAYWPFLAAMTFALKASVSEEAMYRLFALSFGKKILNSFLFAAVLSSLLWGFGHSFYPVYPMWFRGIEVSLLGLFLCLMYWKFGIVTVLVGHYLFDAFWMLAGYLFGDVKPVYFGSAVAVLILPAIFAFIAFIYRRDIPERPLALFLNQHQKFNADILQDYLVRHPEMWQGKSPAVAAKEIARHGWDIVVVETVLERLTTA